MNAGRVGSARRLRGFRSTEVTVTEGEGRRAFGFGREAAGRRTGRGSGRRRKGRGENEREKNLKRG